MDGSLARGLRNQLFRDLNDHVDKVISRYVTYIKIARLDKRPSDWQKFCIDTETILGKLLIAKYLGGTKRKPYLCIYTWESGKRRFNSWTEQCISSSQIFLSFNPAGFEVSPLGFNISDHAIQRIYERSFSNEDPVSGSFSHIKVLNELRYVPFFTGYWTTRVASVSSDSENIFFPSPNGALIGQIQKKTLNRAEIRTFLSVSQLSDYQVRLRLQMISLLQTLKAIDPFLLLLATTESIKWRSIDVEPYLDEYDFVTSKISQLLD
jgi:hypothetical protein